MKNSFRILTFAVLISLFSFVSCKKDLDSNANQTEGTNLTAKGITARDGSPLVSVRRGMLCFNSFSAMHQYQQSLKDEEAVQANIDAAYTTLGIDINAEEIPNLTDNPVCLESEISLGYTSARKVQENQINAQLNAGQDIFSITSDPYWKTILNADNSVYIGSRIYKYYDGGAMAIVINNDWTLYDNIKTKTFEELRQTHNLILTSEVNGDLGNFFTLDEHGKINEAKTILLPRISAVPVANNKRLIYNYSLIEMPGGNPTYKWVYSDNTFSMGLSPRLLNSNETATLEINNGSETTTSVVASPLVCTITEKDLVTTYLSEKVVKFEFPGFVLPSTDYDLRWIFVGNGITTTIDNVNPFIKGGVIPGQSWKVTVQLIWKNNASKNGQVACEFTKAYNTTTVDPPVSCGVKGEKLQIDQFFISGQTWKIDSRIWVQSGEVGCSMKYLRKRLGIWVPAFNQGVSTDISGTYIREEFLNGIKKCNIISASGAKALGKGTYPTTISVAIPEISGVFKNPGQLNSAQKLLVNGAWVGPGINGTPRLILD